MWPMLIIALVAVQGVAAFVGGRALSRLSRRLAQRSTGDANHDWMCQVFLYKVNMTATELYEELRRGRGGVPGRVFYDGTEGLLYWSSVFGSATFKVKTADCSEGCLLHLERVKRGAFVERFDSWRFNRFIMKNFCAECVPYREI